MHQKHYFKALTAMLAQEYCCTPEDFQKSENILTPTVLVTKGRIYNQKRHFFHMATTGGNAVISASPKLHPFLHQWVQCQPGHALSDSEPDTVGTGAAKAWLSSHRNLPYVSPHITGIRSPDPSGLLCGMAHARGTSAVLWEPQFSQRHLSGIHTRQTRCSGSVRLSRNAAYGNGWLFRRHGRLAANRH